MDAWHHEYRLSARDERLPLQGLGKATTIFESMNIHKSLVLVRELLSWICENSFFDPSTHSVYGRRKNASIKRFEIFMLWGRQSDRFCCLLTLSFWQSESWVYMTSFWHRDFHNKIPTIFSSIDWFWFLHRYKYIEIFYLLYVYVHSANDESKYIILFLFFKHWHAS